MHPPKWTGKELKRVVAAGPRRWQLCRHDQLHAGPLGTRCPPRARAPQRQNGHPRQSITARRRFPRHSSARIASFASLGIAPNRPGGVSVGPVGRTVSTGRSPSPSCGRAVPGPPCAGAGERCTAALCIRRRITALPIPLRPAVSLFRDAFGSARDFTGAFEPASHEPCVHRGQAALACARHEVSLVVERDLGGGVPQPGRHAHDGLASLQLYAREGVAQDVEHVRP